MSKYKDLEYNIKRQIYKISRSYIFIFSLDVFKKLFIWLVLLLRPFAEIIASLIIILALVLYLELAHEIHHNINILFFDVDWHQVISGPHLMTGPHYMVGTPESNIESGSSEIPTMPKGGQTSGSSPTDKGVQTSKMYEDKSTQTGPEAIPEQIDKGKGKEVEPFKKYTREELKFWLDKAAVGKPFFEDDLSKEYINTSNFLPKNFIPNKSDDVSIPLKTLAIPRTVSTSLEPQAPISDSGNLTLRPLTDWESPLSKKSWTEIPDSVIPRVTVSDSHVKGTPEFWRRFTAEEIEEARGYVTGDPHVSMLGDAVEAKKRLKKIELAAYAFERAESKYWDCTNQEEQERLGKIMEKSHQTWRKLNDQNAAYVYRSRIRSSKIDPMYWSK